MINDYLNLIKPERMYKQPHLASLVNQYITNSNAASLAYEGEDWFNNTNTDENSSSNSSNDNNSSPSSLLALHSPPLSDDASPVPTSLELYDLAADPFFDQMGSFDEFVGMDVNSSM